MKSLSSLYAVRPPGVWGLSLMNWMISAASFIGATQMFGMAGGSAGQFGVGPLISREHQRKVLSYYELAVKEGAKVITGGGIPKMPADVAEAAVGDQ
mgnify:CR=1 FL=1